MSNPRHSLSILLLLALCAAGSPAQEFCDGLDDDQDGVVDEGCVGLCPGLGSDVLLWSSLLDQAALVDSPTLLVWDGGGYAAVVRHNSSRFTFFRVDLQGEITFSHTTGGGNALCHAKDLIWSGSEYLLVSGCTSAQTLESSDAVSRYDAAGQGLGSITFPDGSDEVPVAAVWSGNGYRLLMTRSVGQQPGLIVRSLTPTLQSLGDQQLVLGGVSGQPRLAWSGNGLAAVYGQFQAVVATGDAAGNPIGAPVALGAGTNAAIAANGSGYGIVWQTAARDRIYYRSVSTIGQLLGPIVEVANADDGCNPNYAPCYTEAPAIAAAGEEFGIAWHADPNGISSVYLRVIEPDGTVVQPDADASGTADSYTPAVAWNGSGFGAIARDRYFDCSGTSCTPTGEWGVELVQLDCCTTDFDGDGSLDCVDCRPDDPDSYPGAPDLCDLIDNDCTFSTPDGSTDPAVGLPCDGGDSDQCLEGVTQCAPGGGYQCTDLTSDDIEVCDGADNDCDGAIDDGLAVDADGDGFFAPGSCGGGDDCDDTDPTLGICNTPSGSNPPPVVTEGASVSFESVTAPGETTIEVMQCNQNELDGLTLGYPDASCVDITTTATWEGLAEVCIDYDPAQGDCVWAQNLSMIGCSDDTGQRVCEVLERSNPNECNGEICAYTSHFSIFAFGELTDGDGDGTVDLLDNCPQDVNFFQFDDDGDGAGNACDCAPADAAVSPGAPEILDGLDNQCPGDPGNGLVDELGPTLRVLDSTTLSWDALPGAQSYEAVRSTDLSFASDCQQLAPIADLLAIDFWGAEPGEPVFYLVRAQLPFAGSWGAGSAGERSSICP